MRADSSCADRCWRPPVTSAARSSWRREAGGASRKERAMHLGIGAKATGTALLAATVALTLAFAGATVLSRAAGARSHQLPARESWRDGLPAAPELIRSGRALFLASCAHCHGADARGDEGPDLHGVQVSDRYIANVIARGIKGEMPAFAKKHGDADVRALIAYVRS